MVAPPISTPTTEIFSFLAIISINEPTAPGVGIIGASVHDISFLYPGACAITCSINKS